MFRNDVSSKVIVVFLFFILTAFYKTVFTSANWVDLMYLPLWVGGLLGLVIADIDQLIFIYYLKPGARTSTNFRAGLENKRYINSIKYLLETKGERVGYLFHTVTFQLLFVVFAFLVSTSTGSILGRGIVYGVLISLLMDQMSDLKMKGNITKWFRNFPLHPDLEQQKWYVLGVVSLSVFLGVFF